MPLPLLNDGRSARATKWLDPSSTLLPSQSTDIGSSVHITITREPAPSATSLDLSRGLIRIEILASTVATRFAPLTFPQRQFRRSPRNLKHSSISYQSLTAQRTGRKPPQTRQSTVFKRTKPLRILHHILPKSDAVQHLDITDSSVPYNNTALITNRSRHHEHFSMRLRVAFRQYILILS